MSQENFVLVKNEDVANERIRKNTSDLHRRIIQDLSLKSPEQLFLESDIIQNVQLYYVQMYSVYGDRALQMIYQDLAPFRELKSDIQVFRAHEYSIEFLVDVFFQKYKKLPRQFREDVKILYNKLLIEMKTDDKKLIEKSIRDFNHKMEKFEGHEYWSSLGINLSKVGMHSMIHFLAAFVLAMQPQLPKGFLSSIFTLDISALSSSVLTLIEKIKLQTRIKDLSTIFGDNIPIEYIRQNAELFLAKLEAENIQYIAVGMSILAILSIFISTIASDQAARLLDYFCGPASNEYYRNLRMRMINFLGGFGIFLYVTNTNLFVLKAEELAWNLITITGIILVAFSCFTFYTFGLIGKDIPVKVRETISEEIKNALNLGKSALFHKDPKQTIEQLSQIQFLKQKQKLKKSKLNKWRKEFLQEMRSNQKYSGKYKQFIEYKQFLEESKNTDLPFQKYLRVFHSD